MSSAHVYRPDIDGLRAIAVLAVVLYHFGIGPLHGGFVGVDVFFVISGYLITGIIHREIQAGTFTFADFYERRIRRIFPALFAVLLATLAVGVWLLLPSDLARLGGATLATLAFVSNVLFSRQSGYFDTSSEYNPLLHTWSLAVEEQFYIGLPILLILIHKFARTRLKAVLAACCIVSFALCLLVQPLRPAYAFFLSPFRAWELLLGGLVAVGGMPAVAHRLPRECVAATALVVLGGSLLWIEAGRSFPGWQAAVPVIATALLLHTGAHGTSLVQRLLSWRPLVLVGLISYSLYLWHWPLAVFARYRNAMEPLTLQQGIALLIVALLISTASYRWIETPLRRRRSKGLHGWRRPVFPMAIAATLVLGVAATVSRLDAGWQRRFPANVVALDAARLPLIPYRECDGKPPGTTMQSCIAGAPAVPPRSLVWGDSHALAWAPAFHHIGLRDSQAYTLAVKSTCPPLLGVSNSFNPACADFSRKVHAWIKTADIQTVYLVATWVDYSNPGTRYLLSDEHGRKGNANVFGPALTNTLKFLGQNVESVMLIGPTPGAPDNLPYKVGMAALTGSAPPLPKPAFEFHGASHTFWENAKAQKERTVTLIDPSGWFCDASACIYRDGHGHLLYRDDEHLSIDGAVYVTNRFRSELDARDAEIPDTDAAAAR
ncbi:acyltransferase family protein [Pseudoxanthomonas koreensis]|uniref:acyltransferase family protein n=1 Tax=Pseudoxanthomonas koreensis TaxID=266061 RepID=UPI0035A697FB